VKRFLMMYAKVTSGKKLDRCDYFLRSEDASKFTLRPLSVSHY